MLLNIQVRMFIPNFSEIKRFPNLSCNFQLAQIGIIESLEHFTPKRIDLFSFFLCVP